MTQTLEGHTVRRYDGELNQLHLLILEMGGLVEEQLREAIKALKEADLDLARKVIRRDETLDQLEIKVDHEVMKISARRCPVGGDLRMVLVVSKCVTELEQAGDQIEKIAALTLRIYDNSEKKPSVPLLHPIGLISQYALNLLHLALTGLDALDSPQAREIIRQHARMAVEYESGLRGLVTFVMEDHRNIGHMLDLALVGKAFERVGDHAKSLAEHIIFLVEGEDVRHQPVGEEGD